MEYNEKSVRKAMEIAGSETGRELLQMIQKANPDKIQKAMQSASEGDYLQAKQILSQALSDPKAKDLLQKLEGLHG